ncbi:MAG: dihydrofolate reductase [Streptococcaceae bacterium]|nr:dihydrofolate reductase [Streptococcaceae bacterium]
MKMKKIIGIWAEDRKGLIGSNNKLPWHLPAELKHFKESTMGQAILSGRKTFESMGKRALPGRVNIVLTRDRDYQAENVVILHDKAEVLSWYKQQDKSLFITGGAEIFRLFEDKLDGLVRTIVDGEFKGDTWFPVDFDFDKFSLVDSSLFHADEKNPYDFEIFTYQRLSN